MHNLHFVKSFVTIDVLKSAVGFFAGGGASLIAREIIANNINEPETPINKIKIATGTVVVGSMVKDAARTHTDGIIDSLVDFATNTKKKFDEEKNKTHLRTVE